MNPNKPVDNACAECGRYLFDLSAEQPYCSSCYEKTALALTLACARAEKAENEADEIAEANERLSANWHKAEEAFGVASRKAREAEAKLAALLASNETLTRKQVEIEKDLREIMNGLYNSDEGWLAVNPSEIYDELHGLLGKHFPTKKEAGL